MRIRALILTGLSALLSQGIISAAEPLKPASEINLAENFTEPAGWNEVKGHTIVDIQFSPDGRQIAVTMDNHVQDRESKTHLLIVDVQNPQAPPRRLDLETCGSFIAWAADGASILVCGRVVHLADGSSCDVSQKENEFQQSSSNGARVTTHWLDAARVIRGDRTTVDLACKVLPKWGGAGNWYVADTASAKGWVLLRRLAQRTIKGRKLSLTEYAIADRDTSKLISGVLEPGAYSDVTTRLAEGAAMVCSELALAGQRKVQHRCWNLPDGMGVPVSPELADYRIAEGATGSRRAIAERWGTRVYDVLSEAANLESRVVADLRTGHILGSVKPRMQREYALGDSNPYYRAAISPDGNMLAEAGDGIVDLYKLP